MIPQSSPRSQNYRHKENKDKSPMLEAELSDAKRSVRDLAMKIDEANSRTEKLQRKPKWRQREEPETLEKKDEDTRYAEVMKELDNVKQELSKLKLDMKHVLKEKRHAERATKASNSKAANLSVSVGLMKKEMEEFSEEQAFFELATKEAVNEYEYIEARRKEDANRYKIKLLEAKKNVEEVEATRELQITVSDINFLESELNMAKEMEAMARRQEESPINSITEELEAAKRELASIKGEGFKFMTSMDVIRDELEHVQDETARLQITERKRDLTVQNLNSKILRAKAKLESLTASETKSNAVASNLVVALEQLRAESESAEKEKDAVNEEIETMKEEIQKTESEIQLAEEKLEAAMEELKAIKSSESKALGDLRNVIYSTVEARDMVSENSSTITITNFEYEYLNRKASEAAELADKKIAAAQAWVEALKANEREILMKVEITQREISELRIEVDDEEEEEVEVEGEEVRINPAEARVKNGVKAVGSPRRSVYRMGTMGPVKKAKLIKLRSPAGARYMGNKSVKRGKVIPKLTKLFSKKNNVAMDES